MAERQAIAVCGEVSGNIKSKHRILSIESGSPNTNHSIETRILAIKGDSHGA